jgi:hypothetical protein
MEFPNQFPLGSSFRPTSQPSSTDQSQDPSSRIPSPPLPTTLRHTIAPYAAPVHEQSFPSPHKSSSILTISISQNQTSTTPFDHGLCDNLRLTDISRSCLDASHADKNVLTPPGLPVVRLRPLTCLPNLWIPQSQSTLISSTTTLPPRIWPRNAA